MLKKPSSHIQILLAIILSVAFASLYIHFGFQSTYFENILTSAGNSFISALQLLAVPLVLFSIIVSMNNIKDATQLSRLGLLACFFYAITTLFAVTLGLIIGNSVQPGKIFNQLVHGKNWDALTASKKAIDVASEQSSQGESILPNNLFALLASNNNLLFVVFFGVLFGIALMQSAPKNRKFMFKFCESALEALTHVMNVIMSLAPMGIFCLVASQLIKMLKESSGVQYIFLGLLAYVGSVLFGLALMLFGFYPLMVTMFSKVGYWKFLRTMRPAQIFAFSTASSTGTLYKTSEQVGKLKVSERIRSFVLSFGATVNMDGTALYQGIAILFITQIFGHELSIGQQIFVAGYVTISSVGVAGLPAASLVTTSILLKKLETMGVMRLEEIAKAIVLISIPDRLLDMARTTANITGDAAVAVLVQAKENKQKEEEE